MTKELEKIKKINYAEAENPTTNVELGEPLMTPEGVVTAPLKVTPGPKGTVVVDPERPGTVAFVRSTPGAPVIMAVPGADGEGVNVGAIPCESVGGTDEFRRAVGDLCDARDNPVDEAPGPAVSPGAKIHGIDR